MKESTIKKIIRGRVYRRKITDRSLITSGEARTKIGIGSLRYLYHLVKMGKLHCIKRRGRLFFRYKEVEQFANQRR